MTARHGAVGGTASVTVIPVGSLAGSSATAPGAVDLTISGPADWAHWGLTTAASFDHKATGGTKISNFTGVGSPVVNTYATSSTAYTWSDGTPTASAAGTKTGVYTSGLNKGFSFTAPADLTSRTLTVYVGGFNCTGRLTAHFSDGTSPDVSMTATNGAGTFYQAFKLTYNAASAGKTLTVTWLDSTGTGNVRLDAATLVTGTPTANFSLSAAPSPVVVGRGSIKTSTVSLTPYYGFASGVTLSASGLPAGVTASFGTNPVAATSVLSLTAGAAATMGTSTVIITGTSGSLTRTTTLGLTVTVPTPTGLTATPGNGQISLAWGAVAGAITYNVKRSTVSGSGYATVASPTAASYISTGLTNGTTYYFVVSAVGASGESPNSAQVAAAPVLLPSVPTGLVATRGDQQVTLVWNAANAATSYNVKRSTVSGSGYATIASRTTTSYTNTGLTNGVPTIMSSLASMAQERAQTRPRPARRRRSPRRPRQWA